MATPKKPAQGEQADATPPRTLFDAFRRENITLTASLAFILIPAIWGALYWHYSGLIDSYKVRIENYEKLVGETKNKLSESEKAKQEIKNAVYEDVTNWKPIKSGT